MNVIVPYSAKDYNLAFSAVSIMISKTNVPPEKIIMYGSRYAPEPSDMLMGLIGRYMQPAEDHSQYPLGPNFMMANLFKQVLAETVLVNRLLKKTAVAFESDSGDGTCD